MFGAYVDGESLLIGLQDLSLDGCQLKDVGIYEREILPGNVCSPMMLKALHKLCCKKKKSHSCTISILKLKEMPLCVFLFINAFSFMSICTPDVFRTADFFRPPSPIQRRSVSNERDIHLFSPIPCITFPSSSTFPESLSGIVCFVLNRRVGSSTSV